MIPPPPPPSGVPPPPSLPPGWTEHAAPNGQVYYFNRSTNVSTYVKPTVSPQPPSGFPPVSMAPPIAPPMHFPPVQKVNEKPKVENTKSEKEETKQKKEKKEKPKTKTPVEGTEWIKIMTNKGNTFWGHSVTKETTWVEPDEVKELREKAEALKRQKKKKVVHDLQDLGDEDWLKQQAQEMLDNETNEPKVEVIVKVKEVEPELTKEETFQIFKKMLEEKDINPMAPWEKELPKFENDDKFLIVKTAKDRQELFNEHCKELLKKRRESKQQKAEKAAQGTLDPKSEYEESLHEFNKILEKNVTSTRTHYVTFKQQCSKSTAFKGFPPSVLSHSANGITSKRTLTEGEREKEREKEFKKWLRELGERKRKATELAEHEFYDLLSSSLSSSDYDKPWSEVKSRFSKDKAYAAVNSSSRREELYQKFVSSNGQVEMPSKPEGKVVETSKKRTREERQAQALEARQSEVSSKTRKLDHQVSRAKDALGREEGERIFWDLIIEKVKDWDASWENVSASLESDPRYEESTLSKAQKERIFDTHQKKLYETRLDALEKLFAEKAPKLNDTFEGVVASIKDDSRATRLVGTSESKLKTLFETSQRKRYIDAVKDFNAMLKENKVIDHWGRIRKEAEKKRKEDLSGILEAEEEDEPDIDIEEMAKQVDLPAILKVLGNDKRYIMFAHQPELRTQWVQEYLENLDSQKLTAHQVSQSK